MGKKNVIADCFYISSLLFLMPLKKLLLPLFTGILNEDRNNKSFWNYCEQFFSNSFM